MPRELTVGSAFSGVGLLDLGLTLAGLEHRWFCESDEFRRGILRKRWPGVPVLGDIRSLRGDQAAADPERVAGQLRGGAGSVAAPVEAQARAAPTGRGLVAAAAGGDQGSVERVDVIAAGFPCKGASSAGKQEGFGHPETVLWREMARAVGELRPRFVLVENVANILALHDGAVWGEVLGDLAALGYDVTWDCLPAAAVGAPHLRDRVFAVATYADGPHQERHAGLRGVANGWTDARGGGQPAADADDERLRPGSVADRSQGFDHGRRGVAVEWGKYAPAIVRWEAVHGPAPEPLVRRVDDRGAARVERSRLSALGDGVQVQLGQLVGEYLMSL